MSVKILKVGAVSLPVLACLELTQSYAPLGGDTILRSGRGTALHQQSWRKVRITTSGSGWIPAWLDAVDTTVAQTLACIMPRLLPADAGTRQATLPATRRSDAGHTPYGLAFLADGSAQLAGASLAGNVATVAAVAGAVAYAVGYYPQYTVRVLRPTDSGDRAGAQARWELVCEEV